MRWLLTANIVASFIGLGISDFRAGETKLSVVAFLFAAANGVIFFWRT